MQIRELFYRWVFTVRPKELGSFLIWLLGIKKVVRHVNGVSIEVNPATQSGIETAKADHLSDRLVRTIEALPKGGSFLDVGANEGLYSLIAAKTVTNSGRVYAVEPQERLWPVMLKNAALNQFFNITIIPYAIGNSEGLETIILMPTTNTGASGLVKGASILEKVRRKQSVRIVKLDRVVRELGLETVDFLKIDVEGFEHSVLMSGRESLSRQMFRSIMVELHHEQLERLGLSVVQVQQLLEDHRYRCDISNRYLFAHPVS
jgi:FkbM family methyltransferase